MPIKFCLACGRLVDSSFAKIGYCNRLNIYKHTPTHRCTWLGQHKKGTLEWRVESWRVHADHLMERVKLLEEFLQRSEVNRQ